MASKASKLYADNILTGTVLVGQNESVVKVLDEFSERALYLQLADDLEKQIRAGKFTGDRRRLPKRSELHDTYDVSPNTVDKAVAELARRRLVVRAQGRGVFARPLDQLPELKTQDGDG